VTSDTLSDDTLLVDIPQVEGFPLLPPCLLVGFLGRGAMGTVYYGHHLRLEIEVAVKCLSPEVAASPGSWVLRFQREASLAARVSHQNLVRSYDVLRYQDLCYLVMELVRGENLRQWVQRAGAMGADAAVAVVAQAAAGLAAAHSEGIVHRDIKPDNVLISTDGAVKVADLGLAKALIGLPDQGVSTLGTATMGTPLYMAPEQWGDVSSVGPQADVFALGATLWFLLVGSDARSQSSLRQLIREAVSEPFPDVRKHRDDVPDDLALVVAKATAVDPSARYADGGEFLRALQAIQVSRSGPPQAPARSKPWTPPSMGPTPAVLQLAKAALSSRQLDPADYGDQDLRSADGEPDAEATDARDAGQQTASPTRSTWIAVSLLIVVIVSGYWAIAGGDGAPMRQGEIVVQPPIVRSAAELEMRQVLESRVAVSWDRMPVDQALQELADKAGFALHRDTSTYEAELIDNGDEWPRISIEGVAPITQLVDLLCDAAEASGDLFWWLDPPHLVVSDEVPAMDLHFFGITPLTSIEGFSSNEIIDLVRENVRPYDWDCSDAYNIDAPDDRRLLVTHEPRVLEQISLFLNRLLHVDPARERSLVEVPLALYGQAAAPIPEEGITVGQLARDLADLLGMALHTALDDEEAALYLEQLVVSDRVEATVEDRLKEIGKQTDLQLDVGAEILTLSVDGAAEYLLVLYDVSQLALDQLSLREVVFNLLPSGTDAVSFSDGVEVDPPLLVPEDSLQSLIQDNVMPDSWYDDPEQTITQFDDTFAVVAPVEVHRKILEMLDAWAAIDAEESGNGG
jgi:serine/threonine protein kinase